MFYSYHIFMKKMFNFRRSFQLQPWLCSQFFHSLSHRYINVVTVTFESAYSGVLTACLNAELNGIIINYAVVFAKFCWVRPLVLSVSFASPFYIFAIRCSKTQWQPLNTRQLLGIIKVAQFVRDVVFVVFIILNQYQMQAYVQQT